MELLPLLNSALQPLESRPPDNGNPEFGLALRSKKIAESTEDDIKQAVRYAMILVGLRAQNFPQDEEKAVLLAFIRRTYAGHTPAEIRLAFEKAVAGELDLTADDVKPYENFSCEYVSRIMRAYRKWAAGQYREEAPRTGVKQIAAPKDSAMDFVDYFYQLYLSGSVDRMIFPESVYDRAKAIFQIVYTEDELKNFVLRAREVVLGRLTEQIKSTDADKRLGEFVALRNEFDRIRQTDPLDSCNVPSVNRLAKLYALEAFFESQKNKGLTTLKP